MADTVNLAEEGGGTGLPERVLGAQCGPHFPAPGELLPVRLAVPPYTVLKQGKSLLPPLRGQAAFPDCYHIPSEGLEPECHGSVPPAVPFHLPAPEVNIAPGRHIEPASGMPVPEAAVDEYHGVVPPQHYVGTSREGGDIHPETETGGKKGPADHQFRTGVPATYMRHAFVPLFFCHLVRHCQVIWCAGGSGWVQVKLKFFHILTSAICASTIALCSSSLSKKDVREGDPKGFWVV